MVFITPILIQAKAIATKQMSYLEIAVRTIVALMVIYYGTMLDFLSGTLED